MLPRSPRTLPLLAAVAVLAPVQQAHAWVEMAVRSDFVEVAVERDGTALVSHELTTRVRGGPLEGFVLEGVDGDAKPVGEATVVELREGSAPAPLPVLLDFRDEGALALEVDHEKGIQRGTFVFRFVYRTHLLERGLITAEGAQADVRWVGPRYPDGIDSAKVVFRLPSAPTPPALPRFDLEQADLGLGEEPGGVFLATLRHAADKDELEVVRPHVAKGEPVVWRVVADARAFSELAPPEPLSSPAPQTAAQLVSAEARAYLIGGAVTVAFLYALLVVLKWRALSLACQLRRAIPRALVPLPAALRAALAGALVAGAGAVALLTDLPTVGGVLLALSMLFAAHVAPRVLPPLRGPGAWKTVTDEVAFARPRHRLPGAWLDASSPLGFVLFVLGVGAFGVGAWFVMPVSPYHALLLALFAASLVPIFCTGRTSALPADAATHPQRTLRRVAARLRRHPHLEVVPLLRYPVGGDCPDELRLLVRPRPAVPGLVAIEVGVEYQMGGGGPVPLPVVLVRALEDSAAHQRLERVAPWSRGRRSEERVALLRPKLPTVGLTASLVGRVATMLTDTRRRGRSVRQPSSKTPIPAGTGAVTAKPATTSSPAHSM